MSSKADSSIYAVLSHQADVWATNELRTISDCDHDEVVCHHFGRSLLAGTHRGKAACLGILKQVREKTNRKPIAVRDVLAGDRYGLIVALKRLVRSCVLAETERALRCGMRVGKLTECWVYDADQRPADEHWAQIDQQSAVKQIRSRRSISYCDEPEAAE